MAKSNFSKIRVALRNVYKLCVFHLESSNSDISLFEHFKLVTVPLYISEEYFMYCELYASTF